MRFWWAMILMVFSFPVLAEWVETGRNDRATVYMDPGTVDKGITSHAKVWLLFDHVEDNRLYAKIYRSSKEFVEFDCDKRRYQVLTFILYPAPMGMGGAIDVSGGKGLWHLLDSVDIRAGIFRHVC